MVGVCVAKLGDVPVGTDSLCAGSLTISTLPVQKMGLLTKASPEPPMHGNGRLTLPRYLPNPTPAKVFLLLVQDVFEMVPQGTSALSLVYVPGSFWARLGSYPDQSLAVSGSLLSRSELFYCG